MTTIDYNNAHLANVLGCNGDVYFCWVDNESGAILREFDETDLEITSEYVELWDTGREAIIGAWVDSTGKIWEAVDETTRETENDFTLDDDFAFEF